MKLHSLHKNKQTGFSLIEVLISLLILGIGLLGLSALQLTALQYNTAAYNRSIATNLAYSIADRMRANKIAANAGLYNTKTVDGPSGSHKTCIGVGNGCDAAALAAFDLDEWKCQLGGYYGETTCKNLGFQGVLPKGAGVITQADTTFTVTIIWDDERNNVDIDTNNCGSDPATNATCFTLVFEPPTLPAGA